MQKNDTDNTKKEINLLPEELNDEIKPSVSLDIQRKKNPKADQKDEPMPSPEAGSGASFLGKLFHKNDDNAVADTTTEEVKHDPVFTKGAKPSFSVAVEDVSDAATKKTPTNSAPVTQAPPSLQKQTPHASEPAAPPASPISLKPEPQSGSSAPKEMPKAPVIPEPLAAPKKEVSVDTKEKKEDQPDRSRLSLSSIKDFLEGEDEGSEEEGFGVNLIPRELQSAEAIKDITKLAILSGLFSVALVGAALVALTFLGASNRQRIVQLQDEVAQYEQEIQSAQSDIAKLAEFTDKTQKVGEVLQGRERWSKLFAFLETETLPEVYYDGVTINANDTVSMNVYAKSYFDLARQYKIFEASDMAGDVTMGGATLSTDMWEQYLTNVRELMASAAEDGIATSTYDNLLNPDITKQYLTVNSTITFTFKVQPEPSLLDKYE